MAGKSSGSMMGRLFKSLLKALFWIFVGAFAVLLLWAYEARNLPDLQAWHRAHFGEEFRASDTSRIKTLKDYLALEGRLFKEVRSKVEETNPRAGTHAVSRFDLQSASCPWSYPQDFNRTYERSHANPRGAVLLLHGLTDSPYSVRALADLFASEGMYVLALRLPGHGTAPSGLLQADRGYWRAAVRIGARHVKSKAGSGPIYLGGYSCGGALAVQYALDSMEEPSLPKPDRLFLFSPAIGITRFAAFANALRALSFIPWFEKSKWTDIAPEYDPFKYNSFPLKAANESFMLTKDLRKQLESAQAKGRLSGMPPVLTFMSAADATVLAEDTAQVLYRRLPAGEHELVLFDVNRMEAYRAFLKPFPAGLLNTIAAKATAPPFRFTLVTNRDPSTLEAEVRRFEPGIQGCVSVPLGLSWPPRVFSLSHVAVPFPLDDPLYGLTPGPGGRITLGNVDLRGESQVLTISMGGLLRLRSNPFFPYMAERIRETVRKDLAPVIKVSK
jgi:alpha-beta hydrolase superfamily lysophospholipase